MKFNKTNKNEQLFDFFVQWHLTEKCNLKCTHCYQEGKTIRDISLPEIKMTVRQISDTIQQWSDTYEIPFSASCNVTGGEPLLRKDLPKILQELARYNFNISVLTNGTLMEKETARRLADIPVSGVQVSLEGPETIHENIRGKYSFSSAVKGVESLLDAGIPVTLNVTLSEMNADFITDMVTVATGLGVQRLGFSRLVPYGRGSSMLTKMLTKERAREIYEQIFSIRNSAFNQESDLKAQFFNRGQEEHSDLNPYLSGRPSTLKIEELQIVTGDPVASQLGAESIDDDFEAFPVGGCAAGLSGITLLPDGTISPCRRLGMSIGNILKDSLREVWATSRVLNALRDKNAYKGKCKTCKRWSTCRGCRAIAYACALSQGRNDFLEEDPQCFID
jgi:AdoMet-dependent heme synthase